MISCHVGFHSPISQHILITSLVVISKARSPFVSKRYVASLLIMVKPISSGRTTFLVIPISSPNFSNPKRRMHKLKGMGGKFNHAKLAINASLKQSKLKYLSSNKPKNRIYGYEERSHHWEVIWKVHRRPAQFIQQEEKQAIQRSKAPQKCSKPLKGIVNNKLWRQESRISWSEIQDHGQHMWFKFKSVDVISETSQSLQRGFWKTITS